MKSSILNALDRMAIVISAAVPVQVRNSGIVENVPITIPASDFDDRWVQIPPDGRDESEIAVSRRFPLHPSVAVSAKRPLPDSWIHRTVQRAPGVTTNDDAETERLLYTIYSTNVSILGARQSDQLITILLQEHDAALFTSTETDDTLGTVRLRIFAVLKAVNPARNEDFCIQFSPIVAVTAIITPAAESRFGKEELLRIYNAFDTARISVSNGTFPNAVTLLTGTLSERFLQNYHYLSPGDERDVARILEDATGTKRRSEVARRARTYKLRTLASAKFEAITDWGTRYFLGTVMQCHPRDAAAIVHPTEETAEANNAFLALFQGLLVPGVGFDGIRQGRAGGPSSGLATFVRDNFPEDSRVLTSPHSIGIIAPGRRLQIVYGEGGAPPEHDRLFGRACAWNVLALSLIGMQEALLAWYHRSVGEANLSARRLVRMAEAAIRDFADYYDISFFKSSASAFFRDAYESMQKVNGLDHEYAMLRERLSLVLARNNGEEVIGVRRTLWVSWLGVGLALMVAVVSSTLAIRGGVAEERDLKAIAAALGPRAVTARRPPSRAQIAAQGPRLAVPYP
ncbi:MAG TPA: hypothetical protein VIW73_05330 [Candidatus Cybelea sp.]